MSTLDPEARDELLLDIAAKLIALQDDVGRAGKAAELAAANTEILKADSKATRARLDAIEAKTSRTDERIDELPCRAGATPANGGGEPACPTTDEGGLEP